MQYKLNPGAAPDVVSKLRKEFPLLPEDYFQFLLQSDGGEGFVGVQPGYFALWQAHEVSECSSSYEVPKYLPGFMAIGSSGGGDLYVLSVSGRPPGLYLVPAIGMEPAVVELVTTTFSEFVSEFGNDWNPQA